MWFLCRHDQVCRNLFPILVTRWCSSAGQIPLQTPAEVQRSPEALDFMPFCQASFINQHCTSVSYWSSSSLARGTDPRSNSFFELVSSFGLEQSCGWCKCHFLYCSHNSRHFYLDMDRTHESYTYLFSEHDVLLS